MVALNIILYLCGKDQIKSLNTTPNLLDYFYQLFRGLTNVSNKKYFNRGVFIKFFYRIHIKSLATKYVQTIVLFKEKKAIQLLKRLNIYRSVILI